MISPSLGTQLTDTSVLTFNSLNHAQSTENRRQGTTIIVDIWSTALCSLYKGRETVQAGLEVDIREEGGD